MWNKYVQWSLFLAEEETVQKDISKGQQEQALSRFWLCSHTYNNSRWNTLLVMVDVDFYIFQG